MMGIALTAIARALVLNTIGVFAEQRSCPFLRGRRHVSHNHYCRKYLLKPCDTNPLPRNAALVRPLKIGNALAASAHNALKARSTSTRFSSS